MSALAERWHDDEPRDGSPPSPANPSRPRTRRPAGREEAGWNVLAEELVAFPTRAQSIWLEGEPEDGSSYASQWLERELESLRRRKVVAFTSSAAALERPVPVAPHPAPRSVEVRRPRANAHRAVRPGTAAPAALPGATRGLRRLLPGAAALAVLVGCWFGVGAMAAAANPIQHVRLAGSAPVRGGIVYLVRPGDTLWAIAARAEPGADPRALVDRLEKQLGGRPLEPGDRLVLPG